MALIDTTDGVLMLGVYDWAFIKPMRKLYYNLVLTGFAVAVAVLIGEEKRRAPLGRQDHVPWR